MRAGTTFVGWLLFVVLNGFSTLQVPVYGQAGAKPAPAPARASGAPDSTDWPTYGGDLRSTRYMPLDQINKENFSKLEVAWRMKTDVFGPRPEFNYQSTPLVVGGVLYVTAGSRRSVIAVDAASGELIWMYRLDEGKRAEAAPRKLSGRGLSTGATARNRASST